MASGLAPRTAWRTDRSSTCPKDPMKRAASLAACLALALAISALAQDRGPSGTRDPGLGSRNSGLGSRDSGLGTRTTQNQQPPTANPGSRLPNREPRIPDPESRIRIAYVFSDGNLPGTLKAFKSLLQERPDLRGRVASAS